MNEGSTPMKHLAAIAILALLITVPLEAQKYKRCEDIPLIWSPTTMIGELAPINLTGLTSIAIEIPPFSDSRTGDDPTLFGENHEDALVKRATTPDDIPAFVHMHFSDTLINLGLRIVKSDGDVILEGDIRRFFVREDNTYEGDVQILVKARRGDEILYEGLATGSSDRFGRSYKAENYYETISDALLEAAHKLAFSSAFRRGLVGE